MKIKHVTVADGNVHQTFYVAGDGRTTKSIGMMSNGRHELGTAQQELSVWVTGGEIQFGANVYRVGDRFVINKGADIILIATEEPATYVCDHS